MRYIIAATVFALVAGIALGFVLRGAAFEAQADEEEQPVREQNLDGDGFIAVHEQGVADVNVVSVPSQAGRLIDLGTAFAAGNNDAVFPLVEVSDCEVMRAMARAPHSSGTSIEARVNTSPDGTTRIAVGNAVEDRTSDTVDGVSTAAGVINGPYRYIQLLVFNGGPDGNMTAWIWCAP